MNNFPWKKVAIHTGLKKTLDTYILIVNIHVYKTLYMNFIDKKMFKYWIYQYSLLIPKATQTQDQDKHVLLATPSGHSLNNYKIVKQCFPASYV